MKKSLRVLITNNTLNKFAGSELYVYDLAIALAKMGHKPVAYSLTLGTVAHRLREHGIPVIDNLNTLAESPDIIHGHHHMETMIALMHFPNVPAIYFCHGWLPWQEAPLRFPRILRYVATSTLCQERLITEGGIATQNIYMLLNSVDLSRFKQRKSLPPSPHRALIFSNGIDIERVSLIKKACYACGIVVVDGLGIHFGNAVADPAPLLAQYDLIFAKGRAALESLAVGAAVISCNGRGAMVTTENLALLRESNFGLSHEARDFPTLESIKHEIEQYDPLDAARVCDRIRATESVDNVAQTLVTLYENVITEYRADRTDRIALGHASLLEYKATSDYLCSLKKIVNRELSRQWQLRVFSNDFIRVVKQLLNKVLLKKCGKLG